MAATGSLQPRLAGYAAALCRELSPAEGLVIEFLERHPERWFTRADGWQRLEALSEALPERGFRKLRPALKRLLGRLPLPTTPGRRRPPTAAAASRHPRRAAALAQRTDRRSRERRPTPEIHPTQENDETQENYQTRGAIR